MYFRLHIFRGILGGAKTESVCAERILIAAAVVCLILTAGIQLAESQLPVIFLFFLVILNGYSASLILNLNGLVLKSGNGYCITEALTRLVNRVRDDLEHRVLAALYAVGAEDDRRSFAHAVGALEHLYALLIVGCLIRHLAVPRKSNATHYFVSYIFNYTPYIGFLSMISMGIEKDRPCNNTVCQIKL